LHWAALKGHLRVTEVLCRGGADLDVTDSWGFSALMRAAQNGHVLEVLLLLQFGANSTLADHEGHHALHWSVFHRHHTVTEWLLKESALVACLNQPDAKGKTPLHLAAGTISQKSDTRPNFSKVV